jgi:hypothetical protein
MVLEAEVAPHAPPNALPAVHVTTVVHVPVVQLESGRSIDRWAWAPRVRRVQPRLARRSRPPDLWVPGYLSAPWFQ